MLVMLVLIWVQVTQICSSVCENSLCASVYIPFCLYLYKALIEENLDLVAVFLPHQTAEHMERHSHLCSAELQWWFFHHSERIVSLRKGMLIKHLFSAHFNQTRIASIKVNNFFQTLNTFVLLSCMGVLSSCKYVTIFRLEGN